MVIAGIKKMEAGFAKIRSELNHHAAPQGSVDRFGEIMKGWVAEAENKFKTVQNQFMLMVKKYDELAEFYCFDRKKVSMDEFFGDLCQFCKEFEVSCMGDIFVLVVLIYVCPVITEVLFVSVTFKHVMSLIFFPFHPLSFQITESEKGE